MLVLKKVGRKYFKILFPNQPVRGLACPVQKCLAGGISFDILIFNAQVKSLMLKLNFANFRNVGRI